MSSPLCDAWVCVKPRLALPALRGFRYGIPVLGFYRSHTLYHCYGVARSPHDGLSASNRVCWNVVVPTPKQGPVRTDLTPRYKNECLAVAQALNEQARKLSQQSRQGVPRTIRPSPTRELCTTTALPFLRISPISLSRFPGEPAPTLATTIPLAPSAIKALASPGRVPVWM